MKTIPLTQGKSTLVDDEDYYLLSENKWWLNTSGEGYAFRLEGVGGKRFGILMHRVIMNAPDGIEVDHIDGNSLNNQKSNLRLCSRSENMCNQKSIKSSKSGIKGVFYVLKIKKFCAHIKVTGRQVSIGYYDTKQEAAVAYNKASEKLHGQFGRKVPTSNV